MINNLIRILKTSRFQEYSRLFLFANKSAYVALRVYQSYMDGGDAFEEFKKSALKNAIDYIDKSIKTLEAIKKEAVLINGKVITAAINPSSERNEILKSAQSFVRIEKAWDALSQLAAIMEHNLAIGQPGDEEVAREDAMNALKVVVSNANAGIQVLNTIKQRLLKEV